jgi:hypothetical protein
LLPILAPLEVRDVKVEAEGSWGWSQVGTRDAVVGHVYFANDSNGPYPLMAAYCSQRSSHGYDGYNISSRVHISRACTAHNAYFYATYEQDLMLINPKATVLTHPIRPPASRIDCSVPAARHFRYKAANCGQCQVATLVSSSPWRGLVAPDPSRPPTNNTNTKSVMASYLPPVSLCLS